MALVKFEKGSVIHWVSFFMMLLVDGFEHHLGERLMKELIDLTYIHDDAE